MKSEKEKLTTDYFWLAISIISGLFVGMLITLFCIRHHLRIFGVGIDIFIAPVVAGFVETLVSNFTRKKSSGAISAIILFFVTNGIGWLFPSQPLSFNIFTVGGFILMLQAAFPLIMNYILISIFLLFTYILGWGGSIIESFIHKTDKTPVTVSEIDDTYKTRIHIFNSKPDIPIKEYHGLVFAEDVIEFEDKGHRDIIQYMGSTQENKILLKYNDYAVARKYILHNLEEEALKINANSIIDVQFEYTNYNQQIPPDVVIAAYGMAVTFEEKYL